MIANRRLRGHHAVALGALLAALIIPGSNTGDHRGSTVAGSAGVSRMTGAEARPTRSPAGTANYRIYSDMLNGKRAYYRWTSCTITYKINPAGAPHYALRDTRAALAEISRATGFRFRSLGTTTYIARRGSQGVTPPTSADLWISWARPGTGASRSNLLVGQLGQGGVHAWSSGSRWAINAGYAVIDRDRAGRLRPGFKSGGSQGGLMLHELGHAMGLAHIGARGQQMYPELGRMSPATLASGDRAGLAAQGRAAGCRT